MSKPRSDSILLNLPEEQQAMLADWLLNGTPYHVARERVAKEFGKEVKSLSAFSEFWNAVCQPALLARRQRAVSTANEVAVDAEKQPGRFDVATIDALKQKAFELSISPNSDPKQVKAIFALVLKANDQAMDAKQLAFEREKFEFDAAKACLAQLPTLKSIAANPSLDNNGKINAIRAKLFGQLPEAAA